MKFIDKGLPPDKLEHWKSRANENWVPEYKHMGSIIKDAVKSALIRDQGGLCCYCERAIELRGSHIEHLRPQSYYDVDPLDYSNLLCSCLETPMRGEALHCGHFKNEWFDDELLVSPLDSTCEEAFAFNGDGHIFPSRNQNIAASTTIEKLGLDCEKLVALRRGAIQPFLDPELAEDEFLEFVRRYLERRDDGTFNAHWSAVRFVFS